MSEQIYANTYEQGVAEGLHTTSSLLNWMMFSGHWTEAEENILNGIETDIDSLKIGLYESALVPSKCKTIKDTLKNAKLKFREYQSKKHRLDHLTADYSATLAKNYYLAKHTIRTIDDEKVKYSNVSSVVDFLFDSKIQETTFREIARSEPWGSLYSIAQNPDYLFGCAAVDLTEEQKNLICWSILYTNIKKHDDCPSKEITEDDDALDGWLIVQQRKRSAEVKKKKVEDIVSNDKIKNSDEIFVVLNEDIDSKTIEDMNDPLSSMRKKQRLQYLAEKGQVHELDMPDMKQKMNIELNRMRKGG